MVEFAKARGWALKDGRIYFPVQQEQQEPSAVQKTGDISLTTGGVIENAIGYARQLETIV